MKKEITYSIRCVPRYVVARFCYEEGEGGRNSGSSANKGEFASFQAAHEIAEALAQREDGATKVVGPDPLTKPKRGTMLISEGEHSRLIEQGYEEADLLRISEANQYMRMGEQLREAVAQDVLRRAQMKHPPLRAV